MVTSVCMYVGMTSHKKNWNKADFAQTTIKINF